MAKDIYHYVVKNALISDGWTITHDPLRLIAGERSVFADLGAEKLVAATKGNQKIAVEVKSFVSPSLMSDIEQAIGQYVIYGKLLRRDEPDRALYLAIPEEIYLLIRRDGLEFLFQDDTPVKIISFDSQNQLIKQWIS